MTGMKREVVKLIKNEKPIKNKSGLTTNLEKNTKSLKTLGKRLLKTAK